MSKLTDAERCGYDLDPGAHALLRELDDFCREELAPRAAIWDRENRFPSENFSAMAQAGWLRLPATEQRGGMGRGIHSDPLVWVLAVETMSRACPNTGQTFQILGHCVSMVEELGSADQADAMVTPVFGGEVICSCGSEPGRYSQSREPKSYSGTVAVAGPDGVTINGRKLFISNSSAADTFFTFTELRRDGKAVGLVHPVARRDDPGIEVLDTWDALGMRGTGSDDVVFKDLFVPYENVIALDRPDSYYNSVLAGSFLTGRAAVYLGVADAALDFCLAYQKDKVGSVDDSVMQYRLGDLTTRLEAAAAMLYRSAALWRGVLAGSFPRDEAERATARAHVFVGDCALAVTEQTLELCGGRGMLRSSPLEQYFRDVRAYTVSPPTRQRTMVTSGAELLLPDVQPESLVSEGV